MLTRSGHFILLADRFDFIACLILLRWQQTIIGWEKS
jgi:hypothetical protein